MDVNDRGSIKWTAMMLPEHQELLRRVWKQQEYKDRPNLDEQQIEEINMKLQLAIHDDLSVIIKYYSDNDYKQVRGKLTKIDTMNKCLLLKDGTKIDFINIIDVKID
ncbi:YolD-like family protein [Ornithinibacillus bavariensis]|uniref:YolD-like family protein n=1 Tax=Ornithinibacillus bavariensis TaxID=545502 RepID=A0A919X8A3_9BACI|nr:YolD-like family protein [Ornithinibacillus bavariensis]GIO26370.1 hypothetical protein J43TS3_09810 [Ornithinibacillus bavariensis]